MCDDVCVMCVSLAGAVCHGPCGIVNIKLKNGDYLVKVHTISYDV